MARSVAWSVEVSVPPFLVLKGASQLGKAQFAKAIFGAEETLVVNCEGSLVVNCDRVGRDVGE